MSLQIGQLFGSYEITALLGKGGMGEVYRARDLKLKREVAIKILPEKFSLDADRAIRFQREAEVLASLNHPNIGAIYDFQRVSCALSICLMESRGAAKESSHGRSPWTDITKGYEPRQRRKSLPPLRGSLLPSQ